MSKEGCWVKCSESRSIKHGSWFQRSNLTFREIILITYVRRDPARRIQREYCLTSSTVADWGIFCRETMLVFMKGCLEKISLWRAAFLCPRHVIIRLWSSPSIGISYFRYMSSAIAWFPLRNTSLPTVTDIMRSPLPVALAAILSPEF